MVGHGRGQDARAGFTFSSIASFNGTNGAGPQSGVILDAQGNIYGTTPVNGQGTVYKIAAGTGIISTLASFNISNGSYPLGLTLDAHGNLYGTTKEGGNGGGLGTVFEIATGAGGIGTGAFSTIVNFSGPNGNGPATGLTLDAQGNFYGATEGGGASNIGSVFKIAAGTNSLSTVASFNGANGSTPAPYQGYLTLDAQGNIYGATAGTTSINGTVFKVAAGSGTISTVATLGLGNFGQPEGGVVLDSKGNIYGTTIGSGPDLAGSVFKISAGTGNLSIIANFNGTNGDYPSGNLTIDSQGNLYGTTVAGGAFGDGSVFEIAAGTSAITTLFSFNGADGYEPQAGLTLDARGDLYGTTEAGGANHAGTVFELVTTAAAVPEPSSLLALAEGMAVVGIGLTASARSRWFRAR